MRTGYEDFRVHLTPGGSRGVSTAVGKGAVASASRQASEFAVSVLKDGGNAFDAAFSLAFSLAIYHPQAGNIGGGGYLLFKEKGSPSPKVYNYREESPGGAARETFVLPDGAPDPEVTAFGPKSACVPGTVKAFFALQKRYGKLKARDLLLALARKAVEGAYVTQYEAECLNRLSPKLAVSPESRKIYVKQKGSFASGDVLRNPDLAKTYEILAEEGDASFYSGRIAEQIERDVVGNGGFLTAGDLSSYEIREVEPICAELGTRRVWTVPPEGGGALIVEILNILGREEAASFGLGTAEFCHFLAQASKIAFIDRTEYLGDIPLEGNAAYLGIFDKTRAVRLFALIDPDADIATDKLQQAMRACGQAAERHGGGSAGGKHSRHAPSPSSAREASGNETTHFSVVDAEGNAVSSSYTMNLRYGSKWSVEGAGFLLNGSMDAFSFSKGKTNYFGVPGSEPNFFARRKRPASNMAPVLVTERDRVDTVLGTPGGPTIPTTLAFILLATISYGVNPVEVVRMGRIHHQGWPDLLYKEKSGIPERLVSELRGKGYTVEDRSEPIGDVHAVFADGEGYRAVSDYRREGCALSHS